MRMDSTGEGKPRRVRKGAAQRRFVRAQQPAPPPVLPEHQEELESLLDMMRMSVQLDDHRPFRGNSEGEQVGRAAFAAHFGELDEMLGEWDERIDHVRAAPGALWGWFERTAAHEEITEPPFSVGGLIDRLALLTVERARRGQLNTAHELHIQRFNDRLAGVERVSVYVEGQNVAQLSGAPQATLEARVSEVEGRVRHLFADAQESAQAVAIGSARDALIDLKLPLLERLAREGAGDAFPLAPSCPVCQPTAVAQGAA
jgi:hypothetical protein